MISFIIEVIPASLIKPFQWRTHSHDIKTNDACCLIRETLNHIYSNQWVTVSLITELINDSTYLVNQLRVISVTILLKLY